MNNFDAIAKKYDRLWFFSEDYQTWMLENIKQILDLQPADLLADIGGGTGVITEKLRILANLVEKPFCVDPALNMLEEARGYDQVRCINDSAEGFVGRYPGLDKVLIKEAIHHIENRRVFWKTLRDNSPKSASLVVTRPKKPGFPLFSEAYARFSKGQPSINQLESEIRAAGFSCDIIKGSWKVTLSKKDWYELVRSRFISDLFDFSKTEIEEGLIELDKNIKSDVVSFDDKIIFLKVSGRPDV